VLHLAHSGGAILTYLAAKFHLTKEETTRIDIATFGGGRSITRKYFHGGRIVNYYTNNDPLLMIDRRASLLSKLLNDSTVKLFFDDDTSAIYHEIRDFKHNTTFIYLDCHYNNPVLDHDMHGPAYLLALKIEARAHQKRVQNLLTIKELSKYWSRLIRKRSARLTGIRHFWESNIYSPRDMNTSTNWNFKYFMPSLFDDRNLSLEIKNLTDDAINNSTIWSWFQSKSSKPANTIRDIPIRNESDLILNSSENLISSTSRPDDLKFFQDRKISQSSIWSWLQLPRANRSSIVIENDIDSKDDNVSASLFEDKHVNDVKLQEDIIGNGTITNDNNIDLIKEENLSIVLAEDDIKGFDDHRKNDSSMWSWFQFSHESDILEICPLKDNNTVDLMINFENVSSSILNESTADDMYKNKSNLYSSLKSWLFGTRKWRSPFSSHISTSVNVSSINRRKGSPVYTAQVNTSLKSWFFSSRKWNSYGNYKDNPKEIDIGDIDSISNNEKDSNNDSHSNNDIGNNDTNNGSAHDSNVDLHIIKENELIKETHCDIMDSKSDDLPAS
jgi:hypothetical protein